MSSDLHAVGLGGVWNSCPATEWAVNDNVEHLHFVNISSQGICNKNKNTFDLSTATKSTSFDY